MAQRIQFSSINYTCNMPNNFLYPKINNGLTHKPNYAPKKKKKNDDIGIVWKYYDYIK